MDSNLRVVLGIGSFWHDSEGHPILDIQNLLSFRLSVGWASDSLLTKYNRSYELYLPY